MHYVISSQNLQFKKLLINFLNFALDIGSLKNAGRLFHNIAPLNFNDRLPNVVFT